MPKIKGTPNSKKITLTISKGDIETELIIVDVGLYKLDQNWKFNGVMTIANSVAIAVRLTDNAALPFA